jgi:membrane protein implicated in regulation of membrane protease activity
MWESFKLFLGIQTNAEAIYWCLAIIGTLFFLLKILFSFFGGDAETSHSDALDGHISLDSIFSFLKVAGWIGVICYRATTFAPLTILFVSLLSGSGAFALIGALVGRIRKLESDGTLNLENAVGKFGTVYLTIPREKSGEGQIQVEVQGRLCTLSALSADAELKTGEEVFVYSVENNKLLVVPKSQAEAVSAR